MKLVLHSPEDIPNLVSSIKDMGFDKPIVVEANHKTDGPSLAQYKLLYGAWYPEIQKHLYDSTGEAYSVEDIDDHFKHKFLPGRLMRVGKDYYRPSVQKRDLNPKTMSEYLDKLDCYCADSLNLRLTHPNDCYMDALMKDM